MGHGETQTRQRSKVERHLLYEPDDGELNGNLKECGENWKSRWSRLSFAKEGQCQKHTHRVRLAKLKGKGLRSFPIPKTKYACVEEAHESTRQRLEASLSTNMKTTWEQRIYLNDPLQFGS